MARTAGELARGDVIVNAGNGYRYLVSQVLERAAGDVCLELRPLLPGMRDRFAGPPQMERLAPETKVIVLAPENR